LDVPLKTQEIPLAPRFLLETIHMKDSNAYSLFLSVGFVARSFHYQTGQDIQLAPTNRPSMGNYLCWCLHKNTAACICLSVLKTTGSHPFNGVHSTYHLSGLNGFCGPSLSIFISDGIQGGRVHWGAATSIVDLKSHICVCPFLEGSRGTHQSYAQSQADCDNLVSG
jgi:hypothetical protein